VRRRLRGGKKSAVPRPFTLLIFGGSQGAHRLNETMVGALPLVHDLKGKIRFIHQTGEKDFSEVRAAYVREGFEAEVSPFIHDMERVYGLADLVMCRAGATTLFELMALGKPAILVPYPYAANDHQTLNAESLVKAGAALRVADRELSPKVIERHIRDLAADPPQLQKMGARALTLARPEAAREIVNLCYEMAGHG